MHCIESSAIPQSQLLVASHGIVLDNLATRQTSTAGLYFRRESVPEAGHRLQLMVLSHVTR